MLSALVTIALLHWLILIIPGANFLLIGQLAASGKRSTAFAAAFGITTVTLTWATLAIMGIGFIFSAHPASRQVLQLAGGAYLGYLGFKLWRSHGTTATSRVLPLEKWGAFRLGFITNVLNPKTALFFSSVFATALPPHSSGLMIASAVALVYINALVWHLFLVVTFSHARIQAAYARHLALFSEVSGAILGAFGMRLIFSTLQEFRTRLA
ncbi:MAG: threonine efflux protein [Rhodoferax sp.]|jgi:threonine efflux protein